MGMTLSGFSNSARDPRFAAIKGICENYARPPSTRTQVNGRTERPGSLQTEVETCQRPSQPGTPQLGLQLVILPSTSNELCELGRAHATSGT